MANTYTPTYNLIKPEVGADTNAWGVHLNLDLDTIDSNMLSRALTSTQTMLGALNLPSNGLNVGSGQLVVSSGNVSASGALSITGAIAGASTLSLTGAASLASTLSVTGAVSLGNNLSVTGSTTLASNGLNVGSGQLNVTGGNVSMSGNLSVTGTQTFTGNTTHSGTLGVAGATTLSSTLSVTGNTTLSGTLAVTGATTLTGNLTIQSSTSERSITLGSSGGYYFGNAANAGWKNSGGTSLVYWDFSGNFTAAANITAYSDARLKTNVRTIDSAVELIEKLRGVYYDRIDSGEASIGVIAQELRDVFPQAVRDNDGTLSVAYGNLVGPLIEAVKELSARLSKLEAA